MAARDDLRSMTVFWLKILLPLAALAVLSTLFLFSRAIDPEDAIPYADVDLEELARQPRLTAPEYAGVTTDGASVTVTATEARPESADARRVTATGLRAVMDAETGLHAELTADSGTVDTGASLLTLSGGVSIETSSGYTIRAAHLTSSLDRTEVIADGAVAATAPYGSLDAGGMVLKADPASEGGHVLVFNGGVKLVYDPRTEDAP